MIASKSWQIHKLQSNVPDCPTIGIRPRSVRSQNAIPQNTGNAGTIFCNPGDCGGIADSRQSNCNPVSRHPTGHRIAIDPELALFRNPFQIAAQPNLTDSNQHNQTGSQLDCRTTKDCNAIDMIALRLHVLQVDCGNCTSHRGIKTSNPSNLLQSFHTDCISILAQVT